MDALSATFGTAANLSIKLLQLPREWSAIDTVNLTLQALVDAPISKEDLLSEVFLDCNNISVGKDVAALPLWSIPHPDWHTDADREGRAIWAKEPEVWDFWVRWWDGVLAGKPLPWDLQEKVALIPDEDWQKGPAHIAEVIRGIEAGFARALTANGEQIIVNPDTGRARLVGDTDLPDDIADYARRKLTKAANIFGPELLNQYAPFRPAIEAIQQTLDDAASLPVEMFDACASASRMSANLVKNEVVPRPDQDAKINEFVTQIREIGADILGHDPKTQDILKRRNEITGNNALIENRDLIIQVAGQLAEASEGPLQRIMERDAEVATSKAVDVGDRHDGSFRLSGKFLRYAVIVPVVATGAFGAAITGGKEIYWLGEKIVTSPQFQTVIEAVMRWLGFG